MVSTDDWANDVGKIPTPEDHHHGRAQPGSHSPPHSTLRLRPRASRSLARRATDRTSKPSTIQYDNVLAWVEQWLLPSWTRDLNPTNLTWCPQWWRHPEAVIRLTALWRSWEHLRMDAGTGLSVWWRDHADTHLPILLDGQGPFKGCTSKGHTEYPVPQLPSDPPPLGLFD